MRLDRALAVCLIAVGVAVATVPVKETRSFAGVAGEPAVEVSSQCVSPIAALFGRGEGDAEWFGYAPNTGVAYTPGGQRCLPGARRRVALGSLLAAAGGGLLYVRRRRQPAER